MLGFLGIGVTMACLSCFGIYPSLNDLFTMFAIYGETLSVHFFKRSVGILFNIHIFEGADWINVFH